MSISVKTDDGFGLDVACESSSFEERKGGEVERSWHRYPGFGPPHNRSIPMSMGQNEIAINIQISWHLEDSIETRGEKLK